MQIPQSVKQAIILTAASVVLGLVVNMLSPRGIPFITPPKTKLKATDLISFEAAKALWETGAAFFLDARAPADYEAGHITLAHNLPVEMFEDYYPEIAPILTTNTSLVVYCDGEECDLSHELQEHLRQMNYQDVKVLVNGWTVWHQANLPTRHGPQP